MYGKLSEVRLKSGEIMEIGVVKAPDEEYAPEIAPFLGHKPGVFKWHIERSLREELDELETYFYIGRLDDEIITNIMTVEHLGVGILGHVFTKPEHRRKGACSAVMREQMEDFRRRGGKALYLGTGYNGPAYHIYASFGFRSVVPGSGFMRYFVEEDFESRWFDPQTAVRVKGVQWHDWGKMTALTGVVDADWLRSVMIPIYGPTNFEGGFLALKRELEEGRRYRDIKLLESERTGAIVGFALLTDDPRWGGNVCVLDLFVHPDFWSSADPLMDALSWPSGKVQCFVESSSEGKIGLLKAYGFQQEALFKGQIAKGSEELDVLCFAWFPQ
jgi:GNAT superfamily N-acetyltransferase